MAKKKLKYNTDEACIIFKLGFYDAAAAKIKYKNKVLYIANWNKLFKEDNFKIDE